MYQAHPTDTIVSGQRRSSATVWAVIGCLVVALCASSLASAETYTVGSAGCSSTTIAAALTMAENHPGPDTIRITRSADYTAQEIHFTTSQELTLTGGFADCTTNTEDAVSTTLNGSGGAHAPVVKIQANTGALIHLRKLAITHGDVLDTSSDGGGIDFTGNGLLDIANTSIYNNTGSYGGGINAAGEDRR